MSFSVKKDNDVEIFLLVLTPGTHEKGVMVISGSVR